MPTLNIKDPDVYELARELARRRSVSMTAAVKQALVETIERSKQARVGVAARLMELGRLSAAIDEPFLTDDDMYDEDGLPK